jgi:predicted O-methyltransferase YrrM
MALKTVLKERSPKLVRSAYRETSFWLGLLTSPNTRFLRHAPPGHFYSPIPDIDDVRRDGGRGDDRAAASLPGVALNEEGQVRLCREFAELYAEMPFPEQPRADCRYHLDNEWFAYGDGIVLYSMMRAFAPARIVEVGSGFSSAAMLEVDDRFFGGRTRLTFIDPHPERLRGLLGAADPARCRIIEAPVQEAPLDPFAELAPGDLLFVDSSHVAKGGSDLLYLVFTVLPALPSGVLVHFHDIPWPFEYPQRWYDRGRAWNEAFFVRALLQDSAAYEVVYFNSFMEAAHRDLLGELLPLSLARPSAESTLGNSSLWIRKL